MDSTKANTTFSTDEGSGSDTDDEQPLSQPEEDNTCRCEDTTFSTDEGSGSDTDDEEPLSQPEEDNTCRCEDNEALTTQERLLKEFPTETLLKEFHIVDSAAEHDQFEKDWIDPVDWVVLDMKDLPGDADTKEKLSRRRKAYDNALPILDHKKATKCRPEPRPRKTVETTSHFTYSEKGSHSQNPDAACKQGPGGQRG